MSFFTKLMADAKPASDNLFNGTKNITNRVVNTVAVQAAKNLSYKGLVYTVGIGLNTVVPVVEKAKQWAEAAVAPVPVKK